MFREPLCTLSYLDHLVPHRPRLLSIVSQGLPKRFASLSLAYATLTKS
jgi:hypothetical protein